MNNYPKNSYQETNSKNRQAGLTPTPIDTLFKNRTTDPNLFLTQNQINTNQFLYNSDNLLLKGIVNNNIVQNPKDPREYGLYLDRKEFKLEMPLYPNISDNVASENVSEYVVIIDSSDRFTDLYPTPFKLKAFFNQNTDSTLLNIPRPFENVKFMRIENVILPRQYFLNKYTITDINSDTVIAPPDKPILINIIVSITPYILGSTDVPLSAITSVEGAQPVEIINLQKYVYTLSITLNGKTGIYNVEYPTNTTYNNQYYLYSYVSGTKMNNNELETTISNYNYNMVTVIGGTKRIIVDQYELIFTLNAITRITYSIKFMIDNEVITRRCYEINAQPGSSNGTLDFYYFAQKGLDTDRYVMLNIEEITDNNINSTNNALRKAFCLLYPDSYGELHYYAASNYQDKIYKMSDLGNINRLTLSLYDSYGKPLQMPNLDYHVNSNKSCNCNDDNYSCPCTYIRHPYYKWLQVQYMIKLGVVETEIDKKIFY